MICSVGDISGGHFNPAVTLAVLAAGRAKISRPDAAKYVGAQLAGGETAERAVVLPPPNLAPRIGVCFWVLLLTVVFPRLFLTVSRET